MAKLVPFTAMVTPGKLSPELSVTFPLILMLCAKTVDKVVKSSKMIKVNFFLIMFKIGLIGFLALESARKF